MSVQVSSFSFIDAFKVNLNVLHKYCYVNKNFKLCFGILPRPKTPLTCSLSSPLFNLKKFFLPLLKLMFLKT